MGSSCGAVRRKGLGLSGKGRCAINIASLPHVFLQLALVVSNVGRLERVDEVYVYIHCGLSHFFVAIGYRVFLLLFFRSQSFRMGTH